MVWEWIRVSCNGRTLVQAHTAPRALNSSIIIKSQGSIVSRSRGALATSLCDLLLLPANVARKPARSAGNVRPRLVLSLNRQDVQLIVILSALAVFRARVVSREASSASTMRNRLCVDPSRRASMLVACRLPCHTQTLLAQTAPVPARGVTIAISPTHLIPSLRSQWIGLSR